MPTPTRQPATSVPADVRRPAQILRADTARSGLQRPRSGTAADTSGLVRRAPGGSPDSLNVAAGGRKGSVETTVKYAAKDSIRFIVGEKKAILYDAASVDYGEMNLKANLITVDYSNNLLTAEGTQDSTGKTRGRPVFKNGAETYQAGRINYNFKSKKGKIADAVTQQGEGYVHAEVIKKNQFNEIFGRNGRYTTCNLEHPHFYINASKMKVIPGEKVVTGPFNLVISDIPTPLGFLFGYFPSPSKSRASGLIIPTFGQSTDRGFFLRNGGYYWAANDNIGLRVTGDIYSGNEQQFGGWRGMAEMQYLKRYRYNGLLSFEFSSRPANQILQQDGVSATNNFRQPRKPQTMWLRWNHSPTPRPGGGRFSASVSAGSSDYNQQNSYDVRRYLTPAFSSNISYSKQLRNAPINYSLNLSQTQNTGTGTMSFILPDVSVQVARQYPYQWLGITPRGRYYEQLSFSYSLTGQNTVTNTQAARQLSGVPLLGGTTTSSVIPIKLDNISKLLRNSQTGLRHDFQIQLGSINFLKHLNLTPSVSYNELWYFKKLDYSYNSAAQAIRIDTVASFNRLSSYSGGLNLGTSIYGTLVRKGTRKFQAIRHKLTPNISYQFAPSRNPNYYQSLNLPLGSIRDASGRVIDTRIFSRYEGFLYGAPAGQRQSQISFSLQNAVEMKVRNNNDTTGTTPFNKVSLIDGLDFGFGYNFLADSLKLTPLAASFRTQVAKKLSITMSASFDFYQRDTSGVAIDKYLFEQDRRRLARLTTASLQMNYQFNPAAKPNKKSNVPRAVAPVNDPALGNPNPINPYEDYVDFELPWEMTTGFSMLYADPGVRPTTILYTRPRAFTSASLNLGGSVKLTNNLRIGYTTNYDFINKTPAFTSLDIYRDLHCWQITGNWRPFRGYGQGYFITIAAKSSLLQDLKLNRNRTFLNY
ncbi:LPS-assembly protein LptD [Microvirga sp. STR05]|uniref:LPS-assembly protein LptD n=1 Tax=Hymenobacter duratus TaxID=2771356 RepID=A0ABR8JGJ4_9BACT|nr:putative LPS assembly protein LptD [Hymenobacter duratus]MBD2714706.1 LPS-assembly protein LptD [Hymenobacter duratus]MBR7949610.1 LPS-assembly protein LptD [Microvirga sp. STR05]